MNVGLITADNGRGGAARAVRRLAKGLTEDKDDKWSIDLVCRGRCEEGYQLAEPSYWFQNKKKSPDKLLYETFDIKAKGWWERYVKPDQEYEFCNEGHSVNTKKTLEKFDLINLFWYQTLGRIKGISRLKKPTVITLHDMWFLTGGCVYSNDCDKYKTGCIRCSHVASRAHKLIEKQYKEKTKLINNSKTLVVVTSSWMMRRAIERGIEQEKIHKINNYIPQHYKFIESQGQCRTAIGWDHLSKKEKVFYFIGNTADTRKGFHLILDAIREKSTSTRKQICLQILGSMNDEDRRKLNTMNVRFKELGYYNDELSQVIAYNASDCVLCPSEYDNSPNVIAEAHCCGIPAIARMGTGAAEMIDVGSNGLLFRQGLIGLEDCMELILEGKFEEKSNEISRFAREKYGKENTCHKYIKIYKGMLK